MSFCIFITWGVSIQFFIPIFFNHLKSYFARMTNSASFVQRSPPKSITRFHHQDAIYLPRPQSLAMVLRVFNLIIKKSETKEETEREGKNNNILPSHHPLLLLIPISPLRPRTALLAANGFIVTCHVTSKKPMRTHASTEKNIQQTLQTV